MYVGKWALVGNELCCGNATILRIFGGWNRTTGSNKDSPKLKYGFVLNRIAQVVIGDDYAIETY
jgi:hypothetical protein